jgi:3-deoxy-D-manno-octulosonic-acid transferase
MKYLIDLIYLLVLIIASPKIIYRMIKHGRYLAGWSHRLGNIGRGDAGKCIWIHAVSVGEVNATRTLVDAIENSLHLEVVISATTDTGYARAKEIYGDRLNIFYFPFDISFFMKRAIRKIAPALILLMELEVWPNLVQIANKNSIPVVVVNGRISDRSYPRYKKIKFATRWMFSKLALTLAQTELYANRFIKLGCDKNKVIVTSSLKYDTAQTTGSVTGAHALKRQINLSYEKMLVIGGSGPGEEKIALDVFGKLKDDPNLADLRMAIIPRKPERFEEVAQLIRQSGFESIRYSTINKMGENISDKPEIILGDTMGDLKKFYALATLVFVGRSLTPMGGSDMMEPTALGKCTIFGPHTFNFRQTVAALLKAKGAIQVEDADEFCETARKCLTDSEYAESIATNGQEIIKNNQGATKKTIEAIRPLLNL